MIKKLIRLLSNSGFLLVFAALCAVIIANSPWSEIYRAFLHHTPPVAIMGKYLDWQLWINDGLMAVFFLLVGLEIKRELLVGELNSRAKAALPAAAAIGGMIVPAAIYAGINWQNPQYMAGWAIPSATDIAFSLAVLSLLGSRIPSSLKIFLTALAIIDDLGAIVIIAVFYTALLQTDWLLAAGLCILALWAANRMRISFFWIYAAIGILLWVAVLKSGIHATLAGVALAAFIPLGGKHAHQSPLHRWEHAIQPFCAYVVLPTFAFANSGLVLSGMDWAAITHPVTIGIAAGLFLGKPIGIYGASYVYLRGSRGQLPHGCGWRHIFGASSLAGIGFTMSLFIGGLAFDDPTIMNQVKLGVIAASIASAILGWVVLRRTS